MNRFGSVAIGVCLLFSFDCSRSRDLPQSTAATSKQVAHEDSPSANGTSRTYGQEQILKGNLLFTLPAGWEKLPSGPEAAAIRYGAPNGLDVIVEVWPAWPLRSKVVAGTASYQSAGALVARVSELVLQKPDAIRVLDKSAVEPYRDVAPGLLAFAQRFRFVRQLAHGQELEQQEECVAIEYKSQGQVFCIFYRVDEKLALFGVFSLSGDRNLTGRATDA